MARPRSLRVRITGAVMVPLAGLVAILVSVTAWAVHATDADTVDRVLAGSVRTLSLAYSAPPEQRPTLLPLAVHLLERRARPVVNYAIHEGDRLVSGDDTLKLPADMAAYRPGVVDLHPPVTFSSGLRPTPLTRGYIHPADAENVVQAAYLRDGMMGNRPVRIATEIRRMSDTGALVTIQIADYLDDRSAYEVSYFAKLAAGGLAILLIAAVFVWWAVTWGLKPFSALTAQIAAAQKDPSPRFRLTQDPATPKEITPFVVAFNELMARLEKASEALRQFTSNASHQMRTPLAVVRIHLDLLDKAGADTPAAKAALADMGNAVESLERLLLQLIALARADEHAVDVAKPFDLGAIAASVTAEQARLLPDDAGDIFLSNERPPMAMGNPALTAELIGNLIDNAIRHNRPGGQVWVTVATSTDGHPRVIITDDGPGIAIAERDLVWERFYRGRRGTTAVGSGLGLPIVRALAERMGAWVSLSDGLGGAGLSVTVDFQPASMAS